MTPEKPLPIQTPWYHHNWNRQSSGSYSVQFAYVGPGNTIVTFAASSIIPHAQLDRIWRWQNDGIRMVKGLQGCWGGPIIWSSTHLMYQKCHGLRLEGGKPRNHKKDFDVDGDLCLLQLHFLHICGAGERQVRFWRRCGQTYVLHMKNNISFISGYVLPASFSEPAVASPLTEGSALFRRVCGADTP